MVTITEVLSRLPRTMTVPHLYFLLLPITGAILAMLAVLLVLLRAYNRTRFERSREFAGSTHRAVRSPRPLRRLEGAIQLGHRHRRAGAWKLEKLLFDNDRDVRVAAVQSLGALRSASAAAALIEGLRREALPEAWIVEQMGKPWAAETIVAALADPSLLGVRAPLAEAAGLAGASAAVPALREMLRVGLARERTHAARALRRLNASEAVPALMTALSDDEWTVRAEAALALGELGDPRAVGVLERALADESWWVQANAASAIGQLGRRGRRALNRLLTSTDAVTRERAREVIALDPVEEPAAPVVEVQEDELVAA